MKNLTDNRIERIIDKAMDDVFNEIHYIKDVESEFGGEKEVYIAHGNATGKEVKLIFGRDTLNDTWEVVEVIGRISTYHLNKINDHARRV